MSRRTDQEAFRAGHDAGYVEGRAAAHIEAQHAALRVVKALVHHADDRLTLRRADLEGAVDELDLTAYEAGDGEIVYLTQPTPGEQP